MKQILSLFFWCLAYSFVTAQPYGTSSINWSTNGNRVIDRNFLGTTSPHPLKFYSNGSMAGYFDTTQVLHLESVPLITTDTLLAIKNGEVSKTKLNLQITAQNGLNTDNSPNTAELGGFLLHNTEIDTKGYGLVIRNYSAWNAPGWQPYNFSITNRVHKDQAMVFRNFNVTSNFNSLLSGADFDQPRNFMYFNHYVETAPPGQKYIGPIINQALRINRAHSAEKVDTINSVINQAITTNYEDWTQYEAPFMRSFVNNYIGYARPYNYNQGMITNAYRKFNTRIELLINPAADTSTIHNLVDLYITNGNSSMFNLYGFGTDDPPFRWSIYQSNNRPNFFKGALYLNNGIKLGKKAVKDTSNNNEPGSLFFDELYDKLKIVNSAGVAEDIVRYTPTMGIPDPTLGTVVDAEARAAIIDILTVLKQAGIIVP